MMGFDDERFTSNITVNPGALGAAPASSSGGFDRMRAAFDAGALQMFGDADKEDAERGTTLGDNAILIDDDGNLNRIDPPGDLTSNAGVKAFINARRAAELAARQNALRHKALELRLLYANDPKGPEKFIDDYRIFSEVVVAESDPDLQNILISEAAVSGRTATIELSNGIKDREFKAGVASSKTNISNLISNVREIHRRGRSSKFERTRAEFAIATALEGGFIQPDEAEAYRREVDLEIVTGLVLNEFLNAKDPDLAGLAKRARERLFGKENIAEELYGLDLTDEDRGTIMDKVIEHVNFMLGNRNTQRHEANTVMSTMLEPIRLLVARGEINTIQQLDREWGKLGLSKKDRDASEVVRAAYRSDVTTITNREGAASKLDDTREIHENMVALLQSRLTGVEAANKAWRTIQRAKNARLYDANPSAYTTAVREHIAGIVARAKDNVDASDKGYRSYFNALTVSGQLTPRIINEMSVLKTPMGEWLALNKTAVMTMWNQAGGADQAKLLAAQVADAEGFPPSAKSVEQDSLLLKYERDRDAANSLRDIWDPNDAQYGAANVANLTARALRKGVSNDVLTGFVLKNAFSSNVEEAQAALGVWEKSFQIESLNGAAFRQTLPQAAKARLIAIQTYFFTGGSKDQLKYEQFLRTLDDDKSQVQMDAEAFSRGDFKAWVETEIRLGAAQVGTWNWNSLSAISVAARLFGIGQDEERLNAIQHTASVDESGTPQFFIQDHDELSTNVVSLLRSTWLRLRPGYAAGKHGDRQALEDTFSQLSNARRIGASNYAPHRRNEDGEVIDPTGIVLMAGAPESYLGGHTDRIIEQEVRFRLEQATFDRTDLPPIFLPWLARLVGFDDVMNSGFVKMVPIKGAMGKDQGSWMLYIDDPREEDIDYKPKLLNRLFQPNLQNVFKINADRLKNYKAPSKVRVPVPVLAGGIASPGEAVKRGVEKVFGESNK